MKMKAAPIIKYVASNNAPSSQFEFPFEKIDTVAKTPNKHANVGYVPKSRVTGTPTIRPSMTAKGDTKSAI